MTGLFHYKIWRWSSRTSCNWNNESVNYLQKELNVYFTVKWHHERGNNLNASTRKDTCLGFVWLCRRSAASSTSRFVPKICGRWPKRCPDCATCAGGSFRWWTWGRTNLRSGRCRASSCAGSRPTFRTGPSSSGADAFWTAIRMRPGPRQCLGTGGEDWCNPQTCRTSRRLRCASWWCRADRAPGTGSSDRPAVRRPAGGGPVAIEGAQLSTPAQETFYRLCAGNELWCKLWAPLWDKSPTSDGWGRASLWCCRGRLANIPDCCNCV